MADDNKEIKCTAAVRKLIAGKASKDQLTKLETRLANTQQATQEKLTELANMVARKATGIKSFLVDARVILPTMGGMALPKGVGMHGYVTVTIPEEAPGQGIAKEDAETMIGHLVKEKYPNHTGFSIVGISELPEGWE